MNIQKAYSAAWNKIKAKSYSIPHDSHALAHAKQQKVILSNVSPFSNTYSSPSKVEKTESEWNLISPLASVG